MNENSIDLSLIVNTDDGDLYQKENTETGIVFSLDRPDLRYEADGRPGQPVIIRDGNSIYGTTFTPSNNTERLVQNIRAFTRGYASAVKTNTPVRYGTRQHEYLNGRNKIFSQNRAYLANDYNEANVQGLNPDDFYEWQYVYVRFSDISQSSSMATRKTDDWKEVMFPQRAIDYYPIGAKLITLGNTWLNINPSNMGSAYATAIMARCNSSYNSYDYYGNVITEPLYIGAYEIRKSATQTEAFHITLMDGNIQVTCQLNDVTKKLGETKRLVIGSKIYFITGFADYMQEFTGDRDSAHLLTFTARVEEPTKDDDMTVNFIAGGNLEHFEAVIDAPKAVFIGGNAQIKPVFVHNENVVASTEQYPVTWEFISSDENVAQIANNGQITAISAGTFTATAILKENPNVTASVEIEIVDTAGEPHIVFEEYKDSTISQYTANTYTAHYYNENGVQTAEPLEWTFSGADYATDYVYGVAQDGQSVVVTCIRPSATPLNITASHDGVSATISVMLEGY